MVAQITAQAIRYKRLDTNSILFVSDYRWFHRWVVRSRCCMSLLYVTIPVDRRVHEFHNFSFVSRFRIKK